MTRSRHNFARRRGFATFMAISLIIIVGAVLLVLGAFFVNDAKRTRSETAEAQLRQLPTAGAVAAMNDPIKPITLPPQIAQQQATVTLTERSTAAGERVILVDATLGKRHMHQTLHLAREGDRWVVRDAALGQ